MDHKRQEQFWKITGQNNLAQESTAISGFRKLHSERNELLKKRIPNYFWKKSLEESRLFLFYRKDSEYLEDKIRKGQWKNRLLRGFQISKNKETSSGRTKKFCLLMKWLGYCAKETASTTPHSLMMKLNPALSKAITRTTIQTGRQERKWRLSVPRSCTITLLS